MMRPFGPDEAAASRTSSQSEPEDEDRVGEAEEMLSNPEGRVFDSFDSWGEFASEEFSDDDEFDIDGLVDNTVASAVLGARDNPSGRPSLARCLVGAGVQVRKSNPEGIFDQTARANARASTMVMPLLPLTPTGGMPSTPENAVLWEVGEVRVPSKDRMDRRVSSKERAVSVRISSKERATSSRVPSKDMLGRVSSALLKSGIWKSEGDRMDKTSSTNSKRSKAFRAQDRGGRSASKMSSISKDSSITLEGTEKERALIQRFFNSSEEEQAGIMLGQQHFSVDRLVGTMFVVDNDFRSAWSKRHHGSSFVATSSWSRDTTSCCPSCRKAGDNFWRRCRQLAHQIVITRAFAAFFIFLTIYSLFGPDLLPILVSGMYCEPGFLILNTVVFCLFCVECLLLNLGSKSYPCSVAFGLDVVALLSSMWDSFFMRECVEPISSQNLHPSLIYRLAHLSKIAKVIRLVPRLLRMVARQTSELARTILKRKVWRAFVVLDADRDGLVSTFDCKVFYLTVMEACQDMLTSPREELLEADLSLFKQVTKHRDEYECNVDFKEFSRLFLSTQVGKELLEHYVEESKNENTVWSLTNGLSENAAVKVCVLVLVTLISLSVFSTEAQDVSAVAGLAHLEAIARDEQLSGQSNSTYICDQIRVYASHYEVLYLYLAGRTYWDDGRCIPEGVPLAEINPHQRVDRILADGGFSAADMLLVCWPRYEACSGSTTSMSLLNEEEKVRSFHLYSFISMVSTAVLLIIFVFLMKTKIQKLTEMFVNPLRSLSDDMVAMSSLQVLNSEDYYDADATNWSTGVVFELHQLHTAFQSLQSAIRSWSKYVPPCVVERLFSCELEAAIGVASCHVTIMFCDIDGFEDACRGLSPERVLELLSDVLGKIAEVIQASEGTLLEFIGDEVLAVFNTPNSLKHHSYVAMSSALEIHRIVGQMPRITLATGKQISIRCRIGIQTAQVLAGNLGSKSRMKFGLLGDGVNLAARLKSLNSRYHTRTLVSKSVLSQFGAQRLVARPVDVVAVKGRTNSTTVYEVLGTKASCSSLVQEGARKHNEAFRLYHLKRFKEAKRMFEEVPALMNRENNGDEASALLARRCAYFLRHPPPPEWDGVERLMQKTWQEGQEGELPDGESESSCEELGMATVLDSKSPGSAFLSDTRSTGDTLRTLAEGPGDPRSQPLCFCGWWPERRETGAWAPRWLLDASIWAAGQPELMEEGGQKAKCRL